MSAILKTAPFISIQDYLAYELTADSKHQYIDGKIYAMEGASKNHQSITDNVLGEIRQRLKNTPCRPFGSDVKIKVGHAFFYPDVMVVYEDKTDNPYYTESPLLVVEVLSKSTRRNDETIRRTAYQSIPGVMEYVLIEQYFVDVDVEVCHRSSAWVSNHYFLGDEVRFEYIDLTLPVSEIYRWVENEDMVVFLAEQANPDG